MARLFFIIWILTAAQICPKFIKIAKVGLKFRQTQNTLSKICLRFLKVCPSGEISPKSCHTGLVQAATDAAAPNLVITVSKMIILNKREESFWHNFQLKIA